MKYIDLFSGAGGMSFGFLAQNFENVLSIDIDKDSVKTYKRNMPNHNVIQSDISKLTDVEIKEIVNDNRVDVVIGGPPCQGFSIAGNIGRKFIEDERNYLFLEFLRVVKIINPKIFVMENVARLATHNRGETIKEICTQFESLGYDVKYEVLDSSLYGVPQVRNRIFVVGTKGCTFNFPKPYKVNPMTVKEAIDDLPTLENGEVSEVPNHFAMKHTKQMLDKMSYVKSGGTRVDIPEKIRPKSGDARKYIRYDKDRPSITITGDMRKVFHYEQNRALSPRELARIQTFPDDFIFEGKSISIQQQIGNAVPPKLSEAIAKEVKKCLTVPV